MRIKEGDTVSVFHYSRLHPFRSLVTSVEDDCISLKLTKEFAHTYFLEEDPAVIVFTSNESIDVLGCIIAYIDMLKSVVKVRVDHVDFLGEEKRLNERFPVSLYADIKVKNIPGKHLVIVKDISLFGLRIFSKLDIFLKQVFEIELYINEKVVFFDCEVVRKEPRAKYIEYGVRILYNNVETLNFIKTYLKVLKEEKDRYMKLT